jgi:hypothetical protein
VATVIGLDIEIEIEIAKQTVQGRALFGTVTSANYEL